MAYSPDGKRLATASDDHTAKVWDAATGQELLTLRGHWARLYGVAYSPDGKRLATASDDHTAKVWDAATGQELLTLRGHSSCVNGGMESRRQAPCRRLVLTGWRKCGTPRTGQELLTLRGHFTLRCVSRGWPLAPMASASPPRALATIGENVGRRIAGRSC